MILVAIITWPDPSPACPPCCPRYFWFVTAFELVVLAIGLWSVMTGVLAKYRGAVVGLFAVASLLYFQFAGEPLGLAGPGRQAPAGPVGCLHAAC